MPYVQNPLAVHLRPATNRSPGWSQYRLTLWRCKPEFLDRKSRPQGSWTLVVLGVPQTLLEFVPRDAEQQLVDGCVIAICMSGA